MRAMGEGGGIGETRSYFLGSGVCVASVKCTACMGFVLELLFCRLELVEF